MEARTDPVPEYLKNGTLLLILARWGWESLTQLCAEPAWRVAAYDRELGWDWQTDQHVPGWRSQTSHPHCDYTPDEAIAWAEIPALPQSRQS